MLLRVKKKIILVYLCTLILLKDPVLLYRKHILFPSSWHRHLHCTKIRSQNKSFIKQFQVFLLSEFYDFTKVLQEKMYRIKMCLPVTLIQLAFFFEISLSNLVFSFFNHTSFFVILIFLKLLNSPNNGHCR